MALVSHTYGKGRVRVMRISKVGERYEARELTVKVMLEGTFETSFTKADNAAVIATDTIKNIVYIVAHDHLDAAPEPFATALGQRYLERYPQVRQVTVTANETKWSRLTTSGGGEHPHGFLLDSNGQPFVEVTVTRDGSTVVSGIKGFTFMKSTGSGWENYVMDEVTTIPPTHDRMCATAMDAHWLWSKEPADFSAANAKVLSTAVGVFADTYSSSVQDSMYRMGEAALAAVPELLQISMTCPNKHYIAANLKPFGLENKNQVFVATDEPFGLIECTVGRS